tara:strand:+ start:3297 stop:3941 length:645 start_codon:yes stop_codon:yes gene_type:complete
MLIITTYVLLLIFLFIVTDFIKHRFLLDSNNSRKIVHIASCVTVCTFPYTLSNSEIYLICFIFVIITSFTKYRNIFKSIHSVDRTTFGAEAYPIGVLIATYCFLPLDKTAFIYGMLVGGFSDSIASVIGKYYKYKEILVFGQKKSLGGSLSFFMTTVIISYLFIFILGIELSVISILIIAFILTMAELVQTFGIDNVTIPVLSGMTLNYFKHVA